MASILTTISVLLFPLLSLGDVDAATYSSTSLCDRRNPMARIALLNSATEKLSDTYTVSQGISVFGECDPEDPNMPESCKNFNNPSLYYGGVQLPCAQDPCPIETPPGVFPGKSSYIQPSVNDAVILFGCLPPPCAYFSVRPYLYERGIVNVDGDVYGNENPMPGDNDDVGQRPPYPTDPETRVVVDTPWHDSYNHLNIRSTASPGEQKFGSAFALISSANEAVVNDIIAALSQSGFPIAAINVDGIPSAWAALQGSTADRDSFRTVMRVAKPCQDQQECDEYVSIGSFSVLSRVLKPKVHVPFVPFLEPVPTERKTGRSETDIVGEGIMKNLQNAVFAKYGKPQYIIPGQKKTFNSSKCIYNGDYCWGDNYDTVYVDFDGQGKIEGARNFVVVCGADHIKLGYSVYTSVGFFAPDGLATGLIDDAAKQGSASCYAPGLPNAELMYCVEVRSSGNCPDPATTSAPCVELFSGSTAEVLFQARINLNPATKTGPDPDELILPVIYGYENNDKVPVECANAKNQAKMYNHLCRYN